MVVFLFLFPLMQRGGHEDAERGHLYLCESSRNSGVLKHTLRIHFVMENHEGGDGVARSDAVVAD